LNKSELAGRFHEGVVEKSISKEYRCDAPEGKMHTPARFLLAKPEDLPRRRIEMQEYLGT
jgi:hypothetical protein